MKTFAAALSLAAVTQAIDLEFKIGEAPDIDESMRGFDPEEMANYDALTGRGDTQEG